MIRFTFFSKRLYWCDNYVLLQERLNNVDKAIPNKMKSTAPTPPISANFKSAKKVARI
jgi:hypothetical protein